MNPILVELRRGGVLESFHRGVICVVDKNGNVVYSRGDIQQVCYPRSAMKYFQHLPIIVDGIFDHFGFTSQELSLMCGSHNGEPIHEEVAQEMLCKIGKSVKDLGCGAQSPTRKSDWVNLIQKGLTPSAIHNNCSGKHAGFLSWNTYHNIESGSYLNPEFELQQRIKSVFSSFYEIKESELKLGIDGCSAPTYAMPVYNQALSYKNLVAPNKNISDDLKMAAQRVVKAVIEYPEMVAGTKRYCTDLMRVTKGRIIGKTGADGVYCLAIPEKKWGISIKVDDGRMGPQYQIAQELLKHLGLITEQEAKELDPYREFDLSNFAGNVVGSSKVVNVSNEINNR